MEESGSTSFDDATLAELIPGLTNLPGAPDETIGRPVPAHLARRDDLSWSALGRMTPRELGQVPNMGPVRVQKLIDELRARVRRLGPLLTAETGVASAGDPVGADILTALREVANWAVGTGQTGSILTVLASAIESPSLDEPASAIHHLAEMDVADLAGEDAFDRYDPVRVAQRLLDSFDERELALLERILDFDGSAPKFQELADRFDVTRQRMQQLQQKVDERLRREVEAPDNRPLLAAATRLRERLGAAIPGDLLRNEFAEYPPDLLDRLVLTLAGPYRFDGDWFVLTSIADFRATVATAFESVAVENVAPTQVVIDALVDLGFRTEHAQCALQDDSRFRQIDEHTVDWRGSLGAKAVLALQLAEQPMSMEEIAAFVEPDSERSMTSQIYADGTIVKVGRGRYALADWGFETFPGIEPTLATRLADGPLPLTELAAELAETYGVSANSVQSIATSHPGFIVRGGNVMLRPADEPWTPSRTLEQSRGCYVIDGVWSWRADVTVDLLRGIGPRIPSAFALHLGGSPLTRGSLESPVGRINLSWGRQPHLGSLRAAARSVDAEVGDFLFVRRVRPSEIDVRILRAADLTDEPESTLRALVGAEGSTNDLEQVLADALGLRGSVNHDLTEERDALLERREPELVELLDALG